MDLYILGLIPKYQKDLAICFIQQSFKFTNVWHNAVFSGTLIWYHTNTNTLHKDTQHTRPIDWHYYYYFYYCSYCSYCSYYYQRSQLLPNKCRWNRDSGILSRPTSQALQRPEEIEGQRPLKSTLFGSYYYTGRYYLGNQFKTAGKHFFSINYPTNLLHMRNSLH